MYKALKIFLNNSIPLELFLNTINNITANSNIFITMYFILSDKLSSYFLHLSYFLLCSWWLLLCS